MKCHTTRRIIWVFTVSHSTHLEFPVLKGLNQLLCQMSCLSPKAMVHTVIKSLKSDLKILACLNDTFRAIISKRLICAFHYINNFISVLAGATNIIFFDFGV